MHRPDHASAVAGAYTAGNPSLGIDATVLTADQLNDNLVENLCRVVEQAGLTLTKLDFDQLHKAVRILAGERALVEFKNLLINPAFGFWQRGTTINLASSGQFITASRWKGFAGGAGTAQATRQVFAAGAPPDTSLGPAYLRWVQSVAGSGPWLEQRTELLEVIDGRKLTLSWWARVSSGTLQVTPRIVQFFGSGGSATVTTSAAAVTVTTTWTRFSVTFDVPSISGKTVGAGAYTAASLLFPTASTFTFEITGAQLEAGPIATALQIPSAALDYLRLCRFEWTTYEGNVTPGTVTNVGSIRADTNGLSILGLDLPFPVEMRTVPALTWFSPRTLDAFGKVERPPGADAVVSSTDDQAAKHSGAPVTNAVSAGVSRAHVFAEAEL